MAHPDDDPPVDWVEGVAIIVAVLIVVSVGSLNDGQKQLIHVHDAVVGDIVLLEPGKVIPCNRVFLSGHNVRCDESSATGDLDAIKKLPYQATLLPESTRDASSHNTPKNKLPASAARPSKP
ncbi:hypothetical protein V8E52_010904 [Russula decolorans]